MGLFRLGKLDKTAEKGDKATKNSPAGEARSGGGSGGGVGGGSAPSQDRPERRKKSRGDEGTGTGEISNSSTPGNGSGGGGIASAPSGGGGGGGSTSTCRPSVNDFISKTKTQQRKGLKPSGPELIAYARYLGIDPVADHDLLWIAVEALEAPLPSEWTEHFDSNDRVFYYNATTRVSSWTHPLEHTYRETYDTIVNFRNCNLSPTERAERLKRSQLDCEQMERDVHREITVWTEHTDEHGHRFYYNSEVRQSTWTDPRPAKCHILYLRMKMIRILETCVRNAGGGGGLSSSYTAEASNKDGHNRYGAPCSPRRDGGAAPASDSTKRPKVAGCGAVSSGLDGVDGPRGDFFAHGGGDPAGHWPNGGGVGSVGGGGGGGGRSAAVAAGVAAPAATGRAAAVAAGVAAPMPGSVGGGGFPGPSGGCDSPSHGGGYEDPSSVGDPEEHDDHHHRKKKKKKKKREHSVGADGGSGGDIGGGGGAVRASASDASQRTLQISQSEPSVGAGGAKVLESNPSMAGENRSFPAPHSSVFPGPGGAGGPFDAQSESLTTQGRARIKAGIRLQPLAPCGAGSGGSPPGGSAVSAANVGAEVPASDSGVGMLGSQSVPELKHLEKLHLL